MVARPVGRNELIGNPKAQASLDVEWDKLMKKKAWDMASVREWEEISKEANPKAQASLDVEWDKLMKKKAWDMASVREWEEISKEAKKKGKKVHVGKVFEICVEKGVLYATAERGERIEAYRAALRSADRLADAMAGLDHLARFSDLTDVFDEPEADADGDATFLGVMTVQEWRDMREFAPNAHSLVS
eukprot:s1347_g10.t1